MILFNLSGHGYFDMAAYDAYLAGKLVDVEYEPQQEAVAVQPDPGPKGFLGAGQFITTRPACGSTSPISRKPAWPWADSTE